MMQEFSGHVRRHSSLSFFPALMQQLSCISRRFVRTANYPGQYGAARPCNRLLMWSSWIPIPFSISRQMLPQRACWGTTFTLAALKWLQMLKWPQDGCAAGQVTWIELLLSFKEQTGLAIPAPHPTVHGTFHSPGVHRVLHYEEDAGCRILVLQQLHAFPAHHHWARSLAVAQGNQYTWHHTPFWCGGTCGWIQLPAQLSPREQGQRAS